MVSKNEKSENEIKIKALICEMVLLNKEDQMKDCFNLLNKLFTNLIDKPTENKFRNFNKKNSHLSSKVLNITQSNELLLLLGYKENSENKDNLELSENNIPNVKICRDEIKNYIDGWAKNPSNQTKKSNESSGLNGNISIFEQRQKQMEQEQINKGPQVTMLIYDISNGMARQFGQQFLGKKLDGVWHTSIVVYNKEYFYGGGICTAKPRQTPFGRPYREQNLGNTEIPEEILNDYLKDLQKMFQPHNYNLIKHNCNHFTNTLAEFLVGSGIPKEILNQHEVLLNTPMGNYIMPMLESINKSPDSM